MAPIGAVAFPSGSPPSSLVERLNTDSHSSVMMSSGDLVVPSRTRTRPDSATSAASSATFGDNMGSLRSSAREFATKTMSIAPRTDDPTRMSACERVERTSSTASSTQESSSTAAGFRCNQSLARSTSSTPWKHRWRDDDHNNNYRNRRYNNII